MAPNPSDLSKLKPSTLLRLHTGEGSGNPRHATWLELFFDLVFVFAIAELAHLLHSHSDLARHPRLCPTLYPCMVALDRLQLLRRSVQCGQRPLPISHIRRNVWHCADGADGARCYRRWVSELCGDLCRRYDSSLFCCICRLGDWCRSRES